MSERSVALSNERTMTPEQIRLAAAATRAAVEAFRREVMEHADRSLRRLQELEAWEQGGPVPASALEYVRLLDMAESAGRCSCGECRDCATQSALNQFQGAFEIDELTERLLLAAAGEKNGSLRSTLAALDDAVSSVITSAPVAARIWAAVKDVVGDEALAPEPPPRSNVVRLDDYR